MGVNVTPTLYAGDDPPSGDWPYERATTIDDAVRVIERGLADQGDGRDYVKAWVPDDDGFIRDVLRRLGATDAWIENRLHYARTGIVLPEKSA